MERLERIKKNAKLDWVDDTDGVIERVDWLEEGDFRWLIKQTEKVEALEKANRKLNHEIGAYSGKVGSIAEKLLLLEKEMLNA